MPIRTIYNAAARSATTLFACFTALAGNGYCTDLDIRNFLRAPSTNRPSEADKPLPPPLLLKGEAKAQRAVPRPLRKLASGYYAGEIQLSYAQDGPFSLDKLRAMTVELTLTADGWTAPQPGRRSQTATLQELDASRFPFHASALSAIAQRIVSAFNEKGYGGIYVSVDPQQKAASPSIPVCEIQFLVSCGYVRDLKTVAAGPYHPGRQPSHKRLMRQCPLTCSEQDGEPCYLNLEAMDAYLYRVNRYPSRSVNAEIDGMPGDGGVDLNLVVNEDKPWHVYVNAATTGNQNTSELWIERVGFIDYQLTRHDDTLAVEYATSGLSPLNSVVGSYEAPWYHCDRLRWRLDGSYSSFNLQAADLNNDRVASSQWRAGPSLIVNIYQRRDFFVDMQFGAYWLDIHADNTFYDVDVDNQFLLPTVTLACEMKRPSKGLQAFVSIQHNLQHLANTNTATIDSLGRLQASAKWWLAEFNLQASSYLPLSDFDAQLGRTLSAHEFWTLCGGQYAFNYRLIPQKEGVIGGFYTVRGYPNALSSGDSVFYAQAEYRYHMRRYCEYEDVDGRTIPQLQPSQWLARFFFDAGKSHYNQRIAGELDSTLLGLGMGAEYAYKKSLVARVDAAVALKDNAQSGTKGGTGRFYGSISWFF